jgi:hypothetical protein
MRAQIFSYPDQGIQIDADRHAVGAQKPELVRDFSCERSSPIQELDTGTVQSEYGLEQRIRPGSML